MRRRLALTLLAATFFATGARAQEAKALFLLHCASCHGESGDGRGTATLDRPARSFLDGGFSYGNTPEALFRTITHGIPGTPMPAAPSVLTDADRHVLADYVLSLGPPTETATVAESTLVVSDRPVIVRGKLPPVGADLPERPRGLLVGTQDGLSFEYRIDDVRLLAVRQGAFADRRDWRGRGGDRLQPLGVPIHLFGTGDPGPTFSNGPGAPLAARLRATSIEGERPWLHYDVVEPSGGAIVAAVRECVHGTSRPAGSGFAREFKLRGSGRIVLRVGEPGSKWFASGFSWTVRRRADGALEAVAARGLRRGEVLSVMGGAVLVGFDLEPTEERSIEILTLLLPEWNADVEDLWLREMRP